MGDGGEGRAWDAFVRDAPDAGVVHLFAWKAVVERAYGHRAFYLAALEGEEIRGVLPLVLVRNPFLGASLVSMPFLDYGGPCAGGHDKAERALIEAAMEIARQEGATLVLRCVRPADLALPCSTDKVSMFLDLGTSEGELWGRLPSERRNRIRKGEKHGLLASFYGREGLGEFYRVFAANMRDLGSPVHCPGFFREILRELDDHARIILVRDGKRAIGAAVMLLFKGTISIPWVASLRADFDKCPNQVLYWEAMRFGITHGYHTLDFGRSSRGSGTYEAKRQWGATPVQLYWHYFPETAPPPEEDLRRMAWAARVWRRLPLPVANALGPHLRRGISN